ncbi:MAG TPA: glycosyltransferase family 2 protein [Candidatus Saccharimonadales bacterium]|nr:glycosyltransferase family 2 protein [Candidatus Saccharimonadales bacterium]
MTDIEIPYKEQRGRRYRFFEIMPGVLSWSMLLIPVVLAFLNVTLAALFVLIYLLVNFSRAIGVAIRSVHGFSVLHQHQRLDWRQLDADLQAGAVLHPGTNVPKWHVSNLKRLKEQPMKVAPDDVIHAIIIATYNESREVLEPTIKSVLASDYDMKKVILILAYEERGGERVETQSKELIKEYKKEFFHAMAVRHPHDIPREIVGKGGNVTYAGRKLQEWLEQKQVDPLRVVVTTLDSDNRPHKKYLAALTYVYSSCPDPVRSSFQPVSVYNNNIWDAPAPMRVLATGNSINHIVQSLRPHALRNFSSHAQGMASLIETDFWSTRTIVEDGHQYWRAYFRFDGNYQVYPLHVPIYQDAVMTDSYTKTFKAQFVQLRRWTYGASDIAYIIDKGFFHKNKVPRMGLWARVLRTIEGHVTWASGPLLILAAGFIPALLHPQSLAANELPLIVSRIQTVALFVGVPVILFICFKTLPPKPARYKRHRTLFMILQWAYLPLTTIIYNSFAAYYSQTRLMFGKYMDKFDVTEKAVVNERGEKNS